MLPSTEFFNINKSLDRHLYLSIVIGVPQKENDRYNKNKACTMDGLKMAFNS